MTTGNFNPEESKKKTPEEFTQTERDFFKEQHEREMAKIAFVGKLKNGEGIDIIDAHWDGSNSEYVIVFPQVKDKISGFKGVYEYSIRLTDDPTVAKLVFDSACKFAEWNYGPRRLDIDEVFKRTSDFSNSLHDLLKEFEILGFDPGTSNYPSDSPRKPDIKRR